MPSAPLADVIAHALPVYGYQPTAASAARLAAYLEFISAAQRRVRLVGSLDADTLVKRHLGESLFLGTLLPLTGQRLTDLGSGAGFPGLALALVHSSLATTLVESNQKKAAFLQEAVQQFGLAARVTVWPHFLDRRPRPNVPSPFEGATLVTARALDKMDLLPTWLSRWFAPATQAAFWVTAERAQAWRSQSHGRDAQRWAWGAFHPLPNAATRGVLLASVSRGTIRDPHAESREPKR